MDTNAFGRILKKLIPAKVPEDQAGFDKSLAKAQADMFHVMLDMLSKKQVAALERIKKNNGEFIHRVDGIHERTADSLKKSGLIGTYLVGKGNQYSGMHRAFITKLGERVLKEKQA